MHLTGPGNFWFAERATFGGDVHVDLHLTSSGPSGIGFGIFDANGRTMDFGALVALDTPGQFETTIDHGDDHFRFSTAPTTRPVQGGWSNGSVPNNLHLPLGSYWIVGWASGQAPAWKVDVNASSFVSVDATDEGSSVFLWTYSNLTSSSRIEATALAAGVTRETNSSASFPVAHTLLAFVIPGAASDPIQESTTLTTASGTRTCWCDVNPADNVTNQVVTVTRTGTAIHRGAPTFSAFGADIEFP